MSKNKNISLAVIKRLPKYHRYLEVLMKNDVDKISSGELGKKIGFTASQIRQDLNCFGEFGQQGYGYNVADLYGEISAILGLTKEYKVVVAGAGNIGQAVTNYPGFSKLGFSIKALFDKNPKLIGIKIKDIEVRDIDTLDAYLKENETHLGVICVPGRNAQEVCDIMVRNNVKGIWNFAPVDLSVPEDVVVENVHLADSLFTLTYLLNDN
ncbi:MAG: redox-sensing transcriptional repressor Rex [Solirubrobacterales bacterium]